MTQTLDLTMDLSRREVKQDLQRRISVLQGPHRIMIKKAIARRSTSQNAYYHSCVVGIFWEYLQDQGDDWTKDQCHEELKKRFLPKREVVSPVTGETFELLGSTTTLDKSEMSAYIERCIQWLAEFFNIVVPAANLYA